MKMTVEYNSEIPVSMEDGNEMMMAHGNMKGELCNRINCKQMSKNIRHYIVHPCSLFLYTIRPHGWRHADDNDDDNVI